MKNNSEESVDIPNELDSKLDTQILKLLELKRVISGGNLLLIMILAVILYKVW